MSILLKNAKILTQNETRDVVEGDIFIEHNEIKKIGKTSEKAEITIDCKDKLAIPGLVNTHTHSAMTLLRGYADDMELNEWLTTKIWPTEAKLTGNDIHYGSLLGSIEMIKSGTTCFADMYFSMDKVALAVDKIGIRANLSHGMIDLGKKEKGEKELKETEEFVRKHNNTCNGRVICSIGPHAVYTCSEELLLKTIELSKRHNLNIQIHVSETRKEVFDCLKEKGKRPVEYLNGLGFLSSKVIASHCVWLTKQEVKILAKNNVKISHSPVSNMKLASGGVSPLKEMLESNVTITLGTDGASSNNSLNLLETIKLTALLQKAHRWDATVITSQQAFDFATRNGAEALGINAGSIEVGKLADIVLLDLKSPNLNPRHNLVSNIVYSSDPSNVSDVIIDGKLVMQDGKILTVDEEKVVEGAQKIAYNLTRK